MIILLKKVKKNESGEIEKPTKNKNALKVIENELLENIQAQVHRIEKLQIETEKNNEMEKKLQEEIQAQKHQIKESQKIGECNQ